MAVQIQIRRGLAANWTSTNPTLAQGEIGYELDTTKFKFGDGALAWNSLPYMTGAFITQVITNGDTTHAPSGDAVFDALALKENLTNKGAANGYAGLDSGGKVPVTQLPNSIMQYVGTWNASTNSPALADGAGNPDADIGDVYRVGTAGTQNLGSGSISFEIGDYAILNASKIWEKADTTDAVASVNGYVGIVTLGPNDIFSAQSANRVYAGPTSGGSAAPTFRALVSADIPSLSGTYVQVIGDTMTGALNINGSTDAIQLKVKSNGTQTNFPFQIVNSSNANILSVTNGGTATFAGGISCGSLSSAGGGSFGAVVTITGSSDANQLIVKAYTSPLQTADIFQVQKSDGTPFIRAGADGSFTIAKTASQLILGTTNTVTLNASIPSASRSYTIPDTGTNSTFLLDNLNSAQFRLGNGSNVATAVTMSGDVTLTNAGVSAIGAAKVTRAMMVNSVAVSVIGRSANSAGVPADIAAGSNGFYLQRQSNALTWAGLSMADATAGTLAIARGGTNSAVALTGNFVMTSQSGAIKEDTNLNPTVLASFSTSMTGLVFAFDNHNCQVRGFTSNGTSYCTIFGQESGNVLHTANYCTIFGGGVFGKFPANHDQIVGFGSRIAFATIQDGSTRLLYVGDNISAVRGTTSGQTRHDDLWVGFDIMQGDSGTYGDYNGNNNAFYGNGILAFGSSAIQCSVFGMYGLQNALAPTRVTSLGYFNGQTVTDHQDLLLLGAFTEPSSTTSKEEAIFGSDTSPLNAMYFARGATTLDWTNPMEWYAPSPPEGLFTDQDVHRVHWNFHGARATGTGPAGGFSWWVTNDASSSNMYGAEVEFLKITAGILHAKFNGSIEQVGAFNVVQLSAQKFAGQSNDIFQVLDDSANVLTGVSSAGILRTIAGTQFTVQPKVGGSYIQEHAAVSSGTTVETTLFNRNIEGNSWINTGDRVCGKISGTFGADVNTKRVKFKVNGTTELDTGALAITAAGSWLIDFEIMMTASGTLKGWARFTSDESALNVTVKNFTLSSLTLSSAIAILVSGQEGGTGGANITMNMGSIDYMPTV